MIDHVMSSRIQKVTVYPAANLFNTLIEKWRKGKDNARRYPRLLILFTSASRSREKVEFMDNNVIFILDINEGIDVSPYSTFDEEEFLLDPSTLFHILSF